MRNYNSPYTPSTPSYIYISLIGYIYREIVQRAFAFGLERWLALQLLAETIV